MPSPLRASATVAVTGRTRLVLALLCALAMSVAPRPALAFCGFYVGGADAKLLAEATQVVLMREGTRTVISMQNDYKGPPEGFAMVVPVPVVLQKDNVKTLPREVFDRIDRLSAPRLVEYWEQDPCGPEDIGLGNIGTLGRGAGQGFGSGSGRLGGAHTVTIEAQFEVGEYEILILSAQDSGGLDTWLRDKGYKIPENAEPALRPYVQSGSKFFVAKVNVAKVKFENGRASLSPLRFHYDSEKFELPVRLGMLNSSGTQDLVVHVLAKDKRFVVANYPSVTIPTNLDVSEAARGSFPAFYAALLDRTLEKTPGAIVTEYAWPSSSCDPCPGGVSGLSVTDLATLGADIVASAQSSPSAQPSGLAGLSNSGGSGSGGLPVGLPSRVAAPTIRQGAITVNGSLPPEVIQRIVRQNFGRYRLCYENGLRSNPNLAGRVTVKFEIGGTGAVTSASDGGSTLADKSVVDCVVHGFRNFSFPEPERKVPVAVVYPLDFAPGSSMPPGGGRFGSGPFASYVLTRLHARYAKDALGSDLVFKEAPPIVGGREMRGESGALETGSVAAPTSAFQARYAIRHEWKGALACKEPRRGVWGRPWADAGASDSSPVAAQKLAYAPRGNLSLAAFVPGGVPELTMTAGAGAGASPAASAAKAPSSVPGADAGGPPPAVPASRCGCRVVGSSGGGPSMLLLAAGVAFAVVRRRRGLARA